MVAIEKRTKALEDRRRGFYFRSFDINGNQIQGYNWVEVVPLGTPPTAKNTMDFRKTQTGG